jgi:predicted aminopeptidase
MFYKYNTVMDYLCMIVGFTGSAISGLAFPMLSFLFRGLLDEFNPTSDPELLNCKLKSNLDRKYSNSRIVLPDDWSYHMVWNVSSLCVLWSSLYQSRVLLLKRISQGYPQTGPGLVRDF